MDFMPYISAFLCGGVFCVIGQILIDKTKLTPAKILVIYVVSGVILGGLGIYKKLIAIAGAGATLPLTGFGYALSKGVKEGIETEGLLGIFTGGVSATAAGITTAVFFAFLIALVCKTKSKN